jgi:hypothetical protein
MHSAVCFPARVLRRAGSPESRLDRLLAGQRNATGAALLVCGLSLVPGSGAVAQSQVYRCTAPDGSIEFRQRRCDEDDSARRLEIEDTRTGWTPPAGSQPRSSGQSPDQTRGQRPKQTRKAPAARDREADYADRCWNKRQQLERVNAQLRAGYKPEQGVKLRRRRSEYEAYLRRYCR